jgi:hydrogenase large subunit
MATIKIIDPITRLEGHLKIEIKVDLVGGNQQVVDAKSTGTLFRGFEKILVGRDPQDAQHITQRICGVCPVPHGMASVIAQDKAYGVSIPSNARIMRNLVMGANFIQSHILHFYHLALQDFVDGPAMPPWQPSWSTDKRISGSAATNLVNNYVSAIDMTRKAHELGALFGGRMPHPPAYIAGGFTGFPRTNRITQASNYLNELISFINGSYIPDVDTVSSTYGDYSAIGEGYGNLLAFGAFPQAQDETNKLFKGGCIENNSTSVSPVDTSLIREQVRYSWYANSTKNLQPARGKTTPKYPKKKAYSWLKAPRYDGKPYEAGPLARMWINGVYTKGISVMDRHKARAQETQKIALSMQSWLNELQAGDPVYAPHNGIVNSTVSGLTEAPRGALGHWVTLSLGKIKNYQVITPTCWNASPRDNVGLPGPIEKALVGTPVLNIEEPIEVLRVIHSFDPCLACAVHVARPAEGKKIYAIGDSEDG